MQLALLSSVSLAELRGTPLLSLQPITCIVAPGEDVLVDMSATGITNLYAFQFDVSFVPEVLAAESVGQGIFLEQGGTEIFVPGRIDNSTGAIQMTIGTLVGTVAGVSGGGVLASISFRALEAGTSPLMISNVILLDSQLQQIIATSTVGSVVVSPEPAAFILLAAGLVGLGALRFCHRGELRQ